ncbi:MAG: hypothetical protein ACK4F9_00040 [Brevinematia bacterium]
MSYLTPMSQLMPRIRNEFYKTTSTEMIDILSSFSVDAVENVFLKFEKKKLNFDEVRKYIFNIPITFAKRMLDFISDWDIKNLIHSYMLAYEFYNLNTLIRAKLSGYPEKDLFLFDYSTVSSRENILSLESIDQIKALYFETLSRNKINNKLLRDTLKTLSLENINDLLVYSSIVYYRKLFENKTKFGYNLVSLLKIKAFYEILLMFAKVSFLSGIDIMKYINNVSFLGGDQEVLMNILLPGKESFIKKCIDYKVIPPNFVIVDLDDIDRFKNTLLKVKCRNLIISNPMDPSTTIAMMILREIDMKNYFSIIGGIVSGFEFEKVRQLLVL